MSFQESGKQRASRIQLDYYKKSSWIDRIKHRLAWLFLLGPLAWMGWTFAQGDRQTPTFSRGQVTGYHSAWNNNCSVCHADFEPISSQSVAMSWLGHVAGKKLTSDSRCESCHTAPVHHTNQKLESTPSCGGCHREHQGQDASLVRLPDRDCTSCHANMGPHLNGGSPKFATAITSFADSSGGHPEFRLLKEKAKDPGSIKFNHQLHLTKGISLSGNGKPWTFADIPEKERSRFGHQKGMPLTAPIQLDCKSCHVLDASDNHPSQEAFAKIPKGALPPRSAGGILQPIVYEQHCRACHPLAFDDKNPSLQVPHRYQPDELKAHLEGHYSRQALGNNQEFDTPVQVRPVPLPGKNPLEPIRESVRQQVKQKVDLAMNTLFLGKKTCGECHFAADDTNTDAIGFNRIPSKIRTGFDPGSKATAWLQEGRAPKDAIWPSIPSLWLPSARFDHAAHRFTECATCHNNAGKSVVKDDILLPNIDSCRNCHAPVSFSPKPGLSGGARHECVECHGYHHGDRPYQGIGSKTWDPVKTREFNTMHLILP